MFGLTHFEPPKKHTDVYFQQAFVADSFKRPSFWAYVNQKSSKLIILISFGLYRLVYIALRILKEG